MKARFNQLASNQRGSVTAEFAICIPVVVFLLALLLGVTYLSGRQNQAQELAKNIAREAILLPEGEESEESLRETARDLIGGDDFALEIVYSQGWVSVEAELPVENPLVGALIPNVQAKITGRLER